MKVAVVSPGRLHAFELALQLHKHKMLGKLITGYPKFVVKKYHIDTSYVTSLYVNEFINRVSYALVKDYPLDYVACEAFDWLNSVSIGMDYDVYIIWSSYALHAIKKIRKKNPKAIIILERGSAHIEKHEELLQTFVGKPVINPDIIRKELAEYEACDYIILPSTFAKKTFVEKGIPAEKMGVISLGVNTNLFPFIQRKMPSEKLVIGYVGTLSKQKNVQGLIEASAILVKQGINVKLLLVGSIDYESFDKSLLQKHSFIEYVEHKPQHELPHYYREMDIFVLNSIQDGFAVVILQAMSTGLPVIASTHSGGPDVISDGENGFLINSGETTMLVEKIKWFWSNKNQITEMGKKARIAVEQNFSWDHYGNKYLAFLQKLAKK